MNIQDDPNEPGILSVRSNLIEVVAVAVVIGFGINLAATGIGQLLGGSAGLQLGVGAVLAVGGCAYLIRRAAPRVNKTFVFEGVLVVRRKDNAVVRIDRYEFAEETAQHIEALTAENKALGKAWRESSLRDFDIAEKVVRRAASPAAKLTQEAIEYFVLNELSIHLSSHFENNPRVSDEEIQRIGRRDIPSVLLDNRFLELFSKPMDEREAFMDQGGKPDRPHGVVVWAMGEGGAIYDSFELILPAGAVVSRTSPVSVRVRTRRLSLQIRVGFEGFSTVLPDGFAEFYLGQRYGDIDTYMVKVFMEVTFAWWALFTSAGWEYYRWLDSFVEKIGRAMSFERFIKEIGWHTAQTGFVIASARTTQLRTPANKPPQPTSGNEPAAEV